MIGNSTKLRQQGAEEVLVHVIGLQRSGTNFLVELIRLNVTDKILPTGDRTLSWKHAMPDERRGAALPAREAILKSSALVCLISKNPVQWVSSVLRSNRHDLFLKRTDLLGADGLPDISKTAALYCRFHSLWIDVLEHRFRTTGVPYVLARYEDVLNQPANALSGIAALLGAGVAADITVPAKVPYSGKMTTEDLDRFRRGEHKLSDAEVLEVRSALRICDAISRLGYQL